MPEECTTTVSSSTSIIPVASTKLIRDYFYKFRNKFYRLTLNMEKLWSWVPNEIKDKATKDNAPLIDVTQFGYSKLLGKGMLPQNQPVVVKAKLVSKIAEQKIKASGGAVIITS